MIYRTHSVFVNNYQRRQEIFSEKLWCAVHIGRHQIKLQVIYQTTVHCMEIGQWTTVTVIVITGVVINVTYLLC